MQVLPFQGSSLPCITKADLLSMLAVPDLEQADIEHILERKERVPTEDRARAESILKTHQFQGWVVAPENRELLVHGNFHAPHHYTSGLSVLCCHLIQALNSTRRLHQVAFFCGRHIEDDDPYAGATGMIRSLVAQLLSQGPLECRAPDSQVGDLSFVQYEHLNIEWLCNLFQGLVRELPDDASLFCFIDGIKFYERGEYIDEMSGVLAFLLNLTRDQHVRCVFKVLVTSPSETSVVRQAFDGRHILALTSMPRVEQMPSYERVLRYME